MNSDIAPPLPAIVRDAIARTVGVVGLLGIGLIHTIDAPGHFTGGPDTYLGVMYVGLIVSCLLLSGALLVRGDRRTWAAAGLLVTSTLVGFILSRTIGLPGDSGDIGNWVEPLGIASLFVEGAFLALAAGVLALGSTSRSVDTSRAILAGAMPRGLRLG